MTKEISIRGKMAKLKNFCAIILVLVMTFAVIPQNVFAAKK